MNIFEAKIMVYFGDPDKKYRWIALINGTVIEYATNSKDAQIFKSEEELDKVVEHLKQNIENLIAITISKIIQETYTVYDKERTY